MKGIKQMQKDKNILKAIQPIKMFKFFYGKYPNQESNRAVCNIVLLSSTIRSHNV